MDVDGDDSLLADTPPQKKQKKAPAPKKATGNPLQEVDNESFAVDATMDGANDVMVEPKLKKGSATDQYQKVRLRSWDLVTCV